MNFTGPTTILIVGTTIEFFLRWQTLCRTVMELSSAVCAEQKSCEFARFACCRWPYTVISYFLHFQPHLLWNNCFLRVRNNLLIFGRIIDLLVDLIADGRGFEVHRTSRILAIFQYIHDSGWIPSIGIFNTLSGMLFPDAIVIRGRDRYLFIF